MKMGQTLINPSDFPAKIWRFPGIVVTLQRSNMEQRYNPSKIDISLLRDYCKQQGECVDYKKGELMERKGEPARWVGFVERGCFKYTVRRSIDGRERIVWFSFETELVGDYPNMLYGTPAQMTIEAMTPCRVWRISGEQLRRFCGQSRENERTIHEIGNHVLCQFKTHCCNIYQYTPCERYEQLLRRCPGIVNDLPLYAIASFLGVTSKTLSKLRRSITFGEE